MWTEAWAEGTGEERRAERSGHPPPPLRIATGCRSTDWEKHRSGEACCSLQKSIFVTSFSSGFIWTWLAVNRDTQATRVWPGPAKPKGISFSAEAPCLPHRLFFVRPPIASLLASLVPASFGVAQDRRRTKKLYESANWLLPYPSAIRSSATSRAVRNSMS
jgi:hypothetical protein